VTIGSDHRAGQSGGGDRLRRPPRT
jgi:hypothetical protein